MPRRKYVSVEAMAQRTLHQDVYKLRQGKEKLEMSAQSKDRIENSLMMAVCITGWVSPPPPHSFSKTTTGENKEDGRLWTRKGENF